MSESPLSFDQLDKLLGAPCALTLGPHTVTAGTGYTMTCARQGPPGP